MNCFLWDIDNCLADDRARIPLIDRELKGQARWTAYHAACEQDPPGRTEVFWSMNMAAPSVRPIFVTGRPESVREPTLRWLCANLPGVAAPLIAMRKEHDERDALEVKREALGRLRRAGWTPLLAFDDRPDIVQMYRDENVPAVVLAAHGDQSPHLLPTPESIDIFALGQLRREVDGRLAQDEPLARDRTPGLADAMRHAADIAASRSAEYGNGYRATGGALLALFGGRIPEIRTEREASRLYLTTLALVKLRRLAVTLSAGSHSDSATDLAVYASMMKEFCNDA